MTIMNESVIAPYKDRLAHELLTDAYELLKLVRKGEMNINIEFVKAAREYLTEIEKEIGSGKCK